MNQAELIAFLEALAAKAPRGAPGEEPVTTYVSRRKKKKAKPA